MSTSAWPKAGDSASRPCVVDAPATAPPLQRQPAPAGAAAGLDPRLSWLPLRYFNFYRIILSGLFLSASLIDALPDPLGKDDPRTFVATNVLYLGLALLFAWTINLRKPAFLLQAIAQIMVDIAVATILIYASGGIGSGLGILLMVAVAGGSLLVPGRLALLFAAIATLAILADQVRWALTQGQAEPLYRQAGTLGIAFFATAALSVYLAGRLRASAALAEQRGQQLAEMARLNEQIIQRMQSGIVVVDSDHRIVMANQAAQALLGHPAAPGDELRTIAPTLYQNLLDWRTDKAPASLEIAGEARTLRANLARPSGLETQGGPATLIFLEDAAALRQQAQLLKTASLGTLTASIAHEIRNPLGAISHAAQLLADESADPVENARIADIIHRHSQRANRIIEEILSVGRERPPQIERFHLSAWMASFLDEYAATWQIDAAAFRVTIPATLEVRFDREQLRQVLVNLIDNARQHAPTDEPLAIVIKATLDERSLRPLLDLHDNGPGISEAESPRLFDPFYTTRSEGNGLGLYLAREICTANQAQLHHVATARGACFRIAFAHPDRQQSL